VGQVDFPLCTDCTAKVKQEIEATIAETEEEVGAYKAAIVRLQNESRSSMTEAEFQKEMNRLQEEEQRERCSSACAIPFTACLRGFSSHHGSP
jgi:septal ring factor EnvC (AmiA/AmiB activator)